MSEEEYENSTVSTKEFICNFSENFAMIDTEVMCSRPSDELIPGILLSLL